MRTRKAGRSGAGRNDRFFRGVLVLLILGTAWWAIQSRTGGFSRSGGTIAGRVQNESLTEISGIVVSRKNRDVIWAHNDSGDSARVFAMKTDGTHLGTFTLAGARSIDYEDIAIGPGPDPELDYLYIADTGNNLLNRTTVTVYRAPEPVVAIDGPPVTERLAGVAALPMRFPGSPCECETLLVDPLSGDLYLVSRDRASAGGGFSLLFRNPAPHEEGVTVTLQLVARFPAPVEIKGGDISPDGSTILLRPHSPRHPGQALRWTWNRDTTLAQVFANPGTPVPTAAERQGEAIAFAADGRSYFTIGEGLRAPIYRYPDRNN